MKRFFGNFAMPPRDCSKNLCSSLTQNGNNLPQYFDCRQVFKKVQLFVHYSKELYLFLLETKLVSQYRERSGSNLYPPIFIHVISGCPDSWNVFSSDNESSVLMIAMEPFFSLIVLFTGCCWVLEN